MITILVDHPASKNTSHLGRVVTTVLVYGWYAALLFLFVVALGAGAYGLYVNSWYGGW
ncbi:MAG: hypothetical protein ACRDF8_04360 [Chloroflexota bacterium]